MDTLTATFDTRAALLRAGTDLTATAGRVYVRGEDHPYAVYSESTIIANAPHHLVGFSEDPFAACRAAGWLNDTAAQVGERFVVRHAWRDVATGEFV